MSPQPLLDTVVSVLGSCDWGLGAVAKGKPYEMKVQNRGGKNRGLCRGRGGTILVNEAPYFGASFCMKGLEIICCSEPNILIENHWLQTQLA